MDLTFGTGIFWIVIGLIASETVVGTVRALRKKKGDDVAVDRAALERRSAELERRLAEVESRLVEQGEAFEAQAALLARVEERAEFTEKLLASRNAPPAQLPPSSQPRP